MAYDMNDVTYGKGDTLNGPVWLVKGGLASRITIEWDPDEELNALKLGEISQDGIEIEMTADENEKMVWGSKSLGSTYTNFKESVTLPLVSSTDADVLDFIYGEDNVTRTATQIDVSVKNSQNVARDAVVIMGKTDDGRANWRVLNMVQVDPNITEALKDDEIITYSVSLKSIPSQTGEFHYKLIGVTPESPETPETPEET